MKLPVIDRNGNRQDECEVGFEVISGDRGTQAVHTTVVAYRAAQRKGTASTKTKGEVAGSGKKPWRQKGTGRARAGSVRSPIWRGGGIVFGPKPRDHSKNVPRKMRRLAFRKALSERILAGEVAVTEDISVSQPKTREVAGLLSAMGFNHGSLLIVVDQKDPDLLLATRNLPNVEVTTSDVLNTYDVLRPDRLLISRAGLEKLQNRVKR